MCQIRCIASRHCRCNARRKKKGGGESSGILNNHCHVGSRFCFHFPFDLAKHNILDVISATSGNQSR